MNTLLAIVLLGALTLAAVPPQGWDDPWLRVGTIVLVLALASWLQPALLVSGVVLVWLLPIAMHGATDEITASPGPLAELLALELIAVGWLAVYRSLLAGHNMARHETVLEAADLEEDVEDVPPAGPTKRCPYVQAATDVVHEPAYVAAVSAGGRSGFLSNSQKMSYDEAIYLLIRVHRIRAELVKTRTILRSSMSR